MAYGHIPTREDNFNINGYTNKKLIKLILIANIIQIGWKKENPIIRLFEGGRYSNTYLSKAIIMRVKELTQRNIVWKYAPDLHSARLEVGGKTAQLELYQRRPICRGIIVVTLRKSAMAREIIKTSVLEPKKKQKRVIKH